MLVYFCLAGKQYLARKGQLLAKCPYIHGSVGDLVITDKVLGIGDVIGTPEGQFLNGARVELKIVRQAKSKKIRVVNFRPQKRHERWKGHRERYTVMEVVQVYWSK